MHANAVLQPKKHLAQSVRVYYTCTCATVTSMLAHQSHQNYLKEDSHLSSGTRVE